MFRQAKKAGLFFSMALASSYISRSTPTRSQRSQDADEKFPMHYKKMKELRAGWQNNPDTAIQGDYQDTQKLWARAMQIKALYQDTHYVFLHGQSKDFTPVIYLINTLTKEKGMPKSRFFKQIRMPCQLPQKLCEMVIFDVQNEKLPKYDWGSFARHLMLSADACDVHSAFENSAFHFVDKDTTMVDRRRIVNDIIWNDNECNFTVEYKLKELIQSFWDDPKWKKNAKCGNLFVFCIPKDLLNQSQKPDHIAYRSHSGGIKCDCHTGRDMEILQDLQNNRLGPATQCKKDREGIPQYRLMTSALTPQNGVLSFMLTPFPKEKRKEMKSKIEDIFREDATNPARIRM